MGTYIFGMFIKQWFQEWLLRRKIKRLIKSPINVASHPLNQVKRVLVLFDSALSIDPLLLRRKVEALADQDAKITFLTFNKKKMDHQNAFFALSPKDLSLTGNFKPWLDDLCKAEYDLVLHFFVSKKPVLEWIGLHLKAPLRVGFKSVSYELNNLILDFPSEGLDGFFESLTKYMQIINQSSS